MDLRTEFPTQTAAGHGPRRGLGSICERGEAIAEGAPRNRNWVRKHAGQRDEAWFEREVAPRHDAFSLKEIGKVTGLSPAPCSRIRAGARVPHPRH